MFYHSVWSPEWFNRGVLVKTAVPAAPNWQHEKTRDRYYVHLLIFPAIGVIYKDKQDGLCIFSPRKIYDLKFITFARERVEKSISGHIFNVTTNSCCRLKSLKTTWTLSTFYRHNKSHELFICILKDLVDYYTNTFILNWPVKWETQIKKNQNEFANFLLLLCKGFERVYLTVIIYGTINRIVVNICHRKHNIIFIIIVMYRHSIHMVRINSLNMHFILCVWCSIIVLCAYVGSQNHRRTEISTE